jgi:hypothetical protein
MQEMTSNIQYRIVKNTLHSGKVIYTLQASHGENIWWWRGDYKTFEKAEKALDKQRKENIIKSEVVMETFKI